MGFHLISRLRDDASLWYSTLRNTIGKRERPRIKGKKIDFGNLDLSRCECLDTDDGKVYVIKTYSQAMKRNIKIIVHYPKAGGHKIYFSIDIEMAGNDIIEYYRTRFQIEFCFWDAKQFTGLNHCQARNLKKQDFAFNASFAAVNIAKIIRKEEYPSLSIGLLKSYISNFYMMNRFFARSVVRPNRTLKLNLSKNYLSLWQMPHRLYLNFNGLLLKTVHNYHFIVTGIEKGTILHCFVRI